MSGVLARGGVLRRSGAFPATGRAIERRGVLRHSAGTDKHALGADGLIGGRVLLARDCSTA